MALGDIGGTVGIDLLDDARATCIFGNWEASGLRGLPPSYRSWVARWPAQLRADSFWAAHASPVWPVGLTIAGVVEYLRERSSPGRRFFRRLQRAESARWAAFAELEAADVALFFTATPMCRRRGAGPPGGAPEHVFGSGFIVTPGERWLIGVGSVGDPHDGEGACYTLYDDAVRQVMWRRV